MNIKSDIEIAQEHTPKKITTDTAEIQKTIREYHAILDKLSSLDTCHLFQILHLNTSIKELFLL